MQPGAPVSVSALKQRREKRSQRVTGVRTNQGANRKNDLKLRCKVGEKNVIGVNSDMKTKIKPFEVQFTPAKRPRFDNEPTWSLLTPPPALKDEEEPSVDNIGTASTGHGEVPSGKTTTTKQGSLSDPEESGCSQVSSAVDCGQKVHSEDRDEVETLLDVLFPVNCK